MIDKILSKIKSLILVLVLVTGVFSATSSLSFAEGTQFEEITTEEHSIWIWSLSHLDENYKKNYCLNYALLLASKIAQSNAGQKAFEKVSKSGESLTMEMVDKIGNYPEIQVKNLDSNWAQYEGDGGGNPNVIYLDKDKLSFLLELCQEPDKEKDVLIFLEATILHETAHWADHVLKYSEVTQGSNFEYKTQIGGDTLGEEGTQLEKDLFGGVMSIGPLEDEKPTDRSMLIRDGKFVDEEQKLIWSNIAWWNELI